jgi:hypothetical protein
MTLSQYHVRIHRAFDDSHLSRVSELRHVVGPPRTRTISLRRALYFLKVYELGRSWIGLKASDERRGRPTQSGDQPKRG